MKKFLGVLLAGLLMALPFQVQAQQQAYVAQSGVTFVVQQAATAGFTSGAVRLPTYSGNGVLNVVEAGITGSPSGCSVVLKYQSNAGGAATSAVVTQAFTPSTGIQQFSVTPSVANGDNYIAVYACSSTYPTAGTISLTFSPGPAPSASASAVTVSSGTLTAVTSITNPVATTINSGTVTAVTTVGTVTNPVTVNNANTPGTTDPCQNPSLLKTSAAISISGAAGTYQIVALSAGKAIYVCGLNDGSAGTTPSFELLPGTGTNCGTPGTALTGAIPFTSGSSIHLDAGGGTVVSTPASDELCAVTIGTGHFGVVTYVQE
jgi:hypothetical protein